MENMGIIAFAVYTLVIIAGALMAVGSRNLVRALVGLIITLVGVAGMYLLLNSPFMAFMQLLIYVGAVAVLIFFAIMLTNATAEGEEGESPSVRKHFFALLAAVAPATMLGWAILTLPARQSVAVPPEVPIKELGHGLLGSYFLPFELISVVLMIAMTGAVLLVWERRNGK